jgi:hypothetical protein
MDQLIPRNDCDVKALLQGKRTFSGFRVRYRSRGFCCSIARLPLRDALLPNKNWGRQQTYENKGKSDKVPKPIPIKDRKTGRKRSPRRKIQREWRTVGVLHRRRLLPDDENLEQRGRLSIDDGSSEYLNVLTIDQD